jgi:hypothetical protein
MFAAKGFDQLEPLADFDSVEEAREWCRNYQFLTGQRAVIYVRDVEGGLFGWRVVEIVKANV